MRTRCGLWDCHEWQATNKESKSMTKTKSNTITDSSWDIPFWFAVLSPVLGILVGFLGLLLFYH
jgi:hypothetical protein